MKPTTIFILMLAATALLIPGASAEVVGASRMLTFNGGMLVDLQLWRFMSASQAAYWYNFISMCILIPIACTASSWNKEKMAVFIPIVAAILVGFGWLHSGDMTKTVGIIIGLGLLGAAIYMKGSLKQNFGLGGPGSTLMNLAIYMVVLGAVFGMLNSAAIWGDNAGSVPNPYTNVDLGKEIPQMSNGGGLMDDIVNTSAIGGATLAAIKTIFAVIGSIACFSGMVLLMFPFLTQSALAVGILGIFQAGVYILYAKLAYDVIVVRSGTGVEF